MYEEKTLSEIIERVEGNIISSLSLSSPVLRVSVAKIFGRVIGMAVWMLQAFMVSRKKESMASTASIDGLKVIGYKVGIYRKPATYATGSVIFTGTEGTEIPQGTVIGRVSDDYTYETTEDAEIDSDGTTTVAISAQLVEDSAGNVLQDVGSDGNCDDATECQLTDSVTGIDSACYISGDIENGYDEESVEEFRERIVYRQQKTPQGGAVSDYVNWATSITGVTDAFVKANTPNVSDVTVVVADYTKTDPSVDQTILDEVDAYINDDIRRPVTATAYIKTVTLTYIDIVLKITPYTDAVITACNSQIKNIFIKNGTPGSTIEKADIQSELYALPSVTSVEITTLSQDGTKTDTLEMTYIKTAYLRSSTYTAFS